MMKMYALNEEDSSPYKSQMEMTKTRFNLNSRTSQTRHSDVICDGCGKGSIFLHSRGSVKEVTGGKFETPQQMIRSSNILQNAFNVQKQV